MDPSKRNAAALTKRVDDLTSAMVQHYGSILSTAQQDENVDYSTTAQRELAIKEDTTAFIRAAQDLSSLIRELQELWLFGGLDTLTDPADEEANKAKALGLAALVEVLAMNMPVPHELEGKNGDSLYIQDNGEELFTPSLATAGEATFMQNNNGKKKKNKHRNRKTARKPLEDTSPNDPSSPQASVQRDDNYPPSTNPPKIDSHARSTSQTIMKLLAFLPLRKLSTVDDKDTQTSSAMAENTAPNDPSSIPASVQREDDYPPSTNPPKIDSHAQSTSQTIMKLSPFRHLRKLSTADDEDTPTSGAMTENN